MSTINTGIGFSARVYYEELEKRGWEFGELYEGVAAAKEMSIEDAEKWEKENYHIRLYNNGDGVMWIPCHNLFDDVGDAEDPGDAEMVEKDIQELYEAGLLWDVIEGENS